ncbi:MAG: hypothetical protein NVS4B11_35840 [Ktedonobacteraceae bacterium]
MYKAINSVSTLSRVAAYRLRQVRQQLGFVEPISTEDKQEVQQWLPASALPLFATMSHADQQHSLRVCRGLQARGCGEHDMLAAALLHDVGKAQGRVPFWTRPAIVLGKMCAPRLLAQVVIPLSQMQPVGTDVSRPCGLSIANKDVINRSLQSTCSIPAWRRALSYAWWHADVGADLAAAAGLSERAVLYIRTHHEPNGLAAELHYVDEVS